MIRNLAYFYDYGRPVARLELDGQELWLWGEQKPTLRAFDVYLVHAPSGDFEFKPIAIPADEADGRGEELVLNEPLRKGQEHGFVRSAELATTWRVMMDFANAGALESSPLFKGDPPWVSP